MPVALFFWRDLAFPEGMLTVESESLLKSKQDYIEELYNAVLNIDELPSVQAMILYLKGVLPEPTVTEIALYTGIDDKDYPTHFVQKREKDGTRRKMNTIEKLEDGFIKHLDKEWKGLPDKVRKSIVEAFKHQR